MKPQWFVDRNHAGKVIGVASRDRKHDTELVAALSDEATATLIASLPELCERVVALQNVLEQCKPLLAGSFNQAERHRFLPIVHKVLSLP